MSMNPSCEVCGLEDAEVVHCISCQCSGSEAFALRARVAELEAQIRESSNTLLAEVRARREAGTVATQREFVVLDARKRIAELEAQLAAANADRARQATALRGLTTWLSSWRHAVSIRAIGAEQAWAELEGLHNEGCAALASSDAAAWLHERDMRVAQLCLEAIRGAARGTDGLCVVDLTEVLSKVSP